MSIEKGTSWEYNTSDYLRLTLHKITLLHIYLKEHVHLLWVLLVLQLIWDKILWSRYYYTSDKATTGTTHNASSTILEEGGEIGEKDHHSKADANKNEGDELQVQELGIYK